jgi:glutamate---cysteine ligase / carboxylate-amine ligase
VIEFVTPVCVRSGDAVEVVSAMRAEAARRGVALLGAGVHPDEPFGDVRHRSGRALPVHRGLDARVMRQTPHCGVHIHVGMANANTAIRACNGMRKWIPLLQALGTNSPFWYGQDSGLASARAVISNSFPAQGIPRVFSAYADFERTVAELAPLGDCPDYSHIWCDVRPHPRLGTLSRSA